MEEVLEEEEPEQWIDGLCVKCHEERTDEGHDPCIPNLPGVLFACCGHGVKDGYIKFNDGRCLNFTPLEIDLDLPSTSFCGVPCYSFGSHRVFNFTTDKVILVEFYGSPLRDQTLEEIEEPS